MRDGYSTPHLLNFVCESPEAILRQYRLCHSRDVRGNPGYGQSVVRSPNLGLLPTFLILDVKGEKHEFWTVTV
jgi:hypothetical protein